MNNNLNKTNYSPHQHKIRKIERKNTNLEREREIETIERRGVQRERGKKEEM